MNVLIGDPQLVSKVLAWFLAGGLFVLGLVLLGRLAQGKD
jgi:hypothetical protein